MEIAMLAETSENLQHSMRLFPQSQSYTLNSSKDETGKENF
jgi:hypothetical protein